MEILESQVEDFDEKEKFYIEKFNSLSPNGYNIAPGGNGLGEGINCYNSIFKTQKEIDEVICEISSTNKSFKNIAKKFGCSLEVICSINSGDRYRQENLVYPLRDTDRTYKPEKIKQVVYALKHEKDKTLRQIAKEYEIDFSQLNNINQGFIYKIKGQKYPLRSGKINSFTKEQLEDIINLLKNPKVSQKEIARKYNVSPSMISSINKGNTYFNKDLTYPIRNNYQRDKEKITFIDKEILKNIEKDLLEGTLSMRNIASKYNIPFPTILNLNKGNIKKYKNDKINYPIRKANNKPVSTSLK